MATGVFFVRQRSSGPRPVQPHQLAVRAARQRADDARVADLLADGLALPAIAALLDIQRSKVNASFQRICANLGAQALGTWILAEGSFER